MKKGSFSYSSSERDLCPWEEGVEIENSENIAISYGPIEFSLDGVFVGTSGHIHFPGIGGSFKIGFIWKWDTVE